VPSNQKTPTVLRSVVCVCSDAAFDLTQASGATCCPSKKWKGLALVLDCGLARTQLKRQSVRAREQLKVAIKEFRIVNSEHKKRLFVRRVPSDDD
jgi:hypothetical protein